MRFNKWREYKQLMEQYQIIVYPRVGAEVVIPPQYRHTIRLVDAPLVEISSTFIRDGIRDGKEMRAFVPERAYEQILLNGWYR